MRGSIRIEGKLVAEITYFSCTLEMNRGKVLWHALITNLSPVFAAQLVDLIHLQSVEVNYETSQESIDIFEARITKMQKLDQGMFFSVHGVVSHEYMEVRYKAQPSTTAGEDAGSATVPFQSLPLKAKYNVVKPVKKPAARFPHSKKRDVDLEDK